MPGIPTGPGAGSQRPPRVIQSPSSSEQSAGPPNVSPNAAGQIGNDSTKSLAEGGQSFSQGIGIKPLLEAGKGDVGDNTNNSGTPSGKTGNFPDAGGGPGNGRQPAAQGSTVAKTLAQPRTQLDPLRGFGGSNPRRGKGA